MKRLDSFVFTGALRKGVVTPQNPRYVRGSLALYDDCDIRVVVERRKRSRSKEQNNYYWGVVLPEIALHTGHSAEELHEIFKTRYLAKKVLWRGGEMKIPKSTSELSTNEFTEFLQCVILEAKELGLTIPEPDKEGQIIKSMH